MLRVRREPCPLHVWHFTSPRDPHVTQGSIPLPLQFVHLQIDSRKSNIYMTPLKHRPFFSECLKSKLTLYQIHLDEQLNPSHNKKGIESSDFPCKIHVLGQHCMLDKQSHLDYHNLLVFPNLISIPIFYSYRKMSKVLKRI